MKSILRATAILSTSSIVTILVGLASAKAWAVLLGPSGLGYMGLLQSLVSIGTLIAGMGIGVALVRMGANALSTEDRQEVEALRQAAWLLLWILGGITLLLVTVFRTGISSLMLGSPIHANAVVLMGMAIMLTLAAGIYTGTLNAHHRVGALAKSGVLHSVIGTGASLLFVWRWSERGIAPAIIAGSVAGLIIPAYYAAKQLEPSRARPARQQVFRAMGRLLRFGAPYTASLAVGTGVQFVLPTLVLHNLGEVNVGYFRAAAAVSVTYLGFLVNAMSQDYFPRTSAASDDAPELIRLVNQQHRLIMLLSAPMVLGVLATAPLLIPLIYSAEFSPAVEVLEWQLIGDLFKFSSWTTGFVLLARNKSGAFFFAELTIGITTIFASWYGMRWFGLAGLGMAFLATYVVLYMFNWMVVRREIGLVWTVENKRLLLAALMAAGIVRLLPLVGLASLRTPVALLLATASGLFSLYTIMQEAKGVPNVRV